MNFIHIPDESSSLLNHLGQSVWLGLDKVHKDIQAPLDAFPYLLWRVSQGPAHFSRHLPPSKFSIAYMPQTLVGKSVSPTSWCA